MDQETKEILLHYSLHIEKNPYYSLEFDDGGLMVSLSDSAREYVLSHKPRKNKGKNYTFHKKLTCFFCRKKIDPPLSLCNCKKDELLLMSGPYDYFLPNVTSIDSQLYREITYLPSKISNAEYRKNNKQKHQPYWMHPYLQRTRHVETQIEDRKLFINLSKSAKKNLTRTRKYKNNKLLQSLFNELKCSFCNKVITSPLSDCNCDKESSLFTNIIFEYFLSGTCDNLQEMSDFLLSLESNFYQTYRTDLRQKTLKNLPENHSKCDIDWLYKIQNSKCYFCSAHLEKTSYHKDHLIPICSNGRDNIVNIALTCRSCNLSKASKTEEEFLINKKNELSPKSFESQLKFIEKVKEEKLLYVNTLSIDLYN